MESTIANAAAASGMELRALLDDDDYVDFKDDEECVMFFDSNEECDNEEYHDFRELGVPESAETEESTKYIVEMSEEDSWANQPISRLPVLSMGDFEGERANAKAMARELAVLWDLPEESNEATTTDSPSTLLTEPQCADSVSAGGRGATQKRDRKKQNRRRRRNDSREMDYFLS